MSDNIFEKATRLGLQFDSAQGQLEIHDLWDLPLSSKQDKRANLDDIAKGLYKKLQNSSDISFVETETRTDTISQLKFDIVKHIISVRLEENKIARETKERSEKKQQLLALVAQKEGEHLAGLSLDELKAKISELS